MADDGKRCLDGRLEWYYNVFYPERDVRIVLQCVGGSVEVRTMAADDVDYEYDLLLVRI